MDNKFGEFDQLFDSFFYSGLQNKNFGGESRYFINGKELSLDELQESPKNGGNKKGDKSNNSNNGNPLELFGRNLTQEARNGMLDEVIGRRKEIQDTAEILSRRTKNNPILVGEAGVGKTAVVEGLAQAIVKGEVPRSIMDKELYAIDISVLEAGTQYRGAFEEKVEKLLNEVKKQANVILFFDEIHQILGAGSTGNESGSKGLADILKPALSRGEVSLIGATTQDEYRNTILKNNALSRRFNEIKVSEPSTEDTLEMLEGIAPLYGEHHKVKLSKEVLKAAIDYSVQYIPQRFLPDKAIDLIDMTSAHLAAKNHVSYRVALEEDLKRNELKKEKSISDENFNKAAEYQDNIESIKNQLKEYKEITMDNYTVVTVNDIAESVERLTGIPVSQLTTNDLEKLTNMNRKLKSKIIGQDEAVDIISKAIRRNRTGFDEGNRPIGSFLFIGPTGVGKTELAKQLAIEMFGDKEAVIRLDMSEYSDLTAISKLIGTTAGYIGYEDNGNTLTEKVRRTPYSIVLLDEIEKAHPQVLTLLLQLMDDGRLTDGQGNTINFKNTVIIATSNAGFGVKSAYRKREPKVLSNVEELLSPYFKPEFLNRFNAIVEFSHLTKEDLTEIVNLMIDDVNRTLEKKDIILTVSDEAKSWLVNEGYDEALGARPLRRVIEQQIRDKIADLYLQDQNIREVEAVLEDKNIKMIKIM
ncbi:ATP-dependent Clp protease ATP-binding subunit [Enterococcus faecalis]|nr:ATP-dependent Clp protease ATP-binding subunit [Enterococcus faecalis]